MAARDERDTLGPSDSRVRDLPGGGAEGHDHVLVLEPGEIRRVHPGII